LSKSLIDELQSRDLRADFAKMADIFPAEAPLLVSPTGYYFNTGTSGSSYDIGYEYQFSHGWVLAQFTLVRADGQLRISKFNVYPMSASLEEQNAFTLRGKGAIHYIVLLLGAIALSVSVTALVKCIRTRGLRRKWLWIIFILFGFGALTINWTTGEWHLALLHFQLLSYSAFAPYGSPWTVGVSVPVGAVVFLDKLRRERRSAGAPFSDTPPPLA
jgi:hypothetical protein